MWRGIHGGGGRFGLVPQDASEAVVGPDVAPCAAFLPGANWVNGFGAPIHGARHGNGQPGHSTWGSNGSGRTR